MADDSKTIGQIAYEANWPPKLNCRDYNKELTPDQHRYWDRAASAVWDQAVEACIQAQRKAIDEAVSEMNEMALLGVKPLWNSLISRFDDLPEALRSLKRSQSQTEEDK